MSLQLIKLILFGTCEILYWISQKRIRLGGHGIFADVSNNVILQRASHYNFYWLHFQIWVVMFFWISMRNAFQRYVTWHALERKIFNLAWKPFLVCKIHKQVPTFWVWDLIIIHFWPLNYNCAKFHACTSLCTNFMVISTIRLHYTL